MTTSSTTYLSSEDPSLSALLPLEIQNSTLSGLYGGTTVRVVLRSPLTTFIGPNGTGKTQLLRQVKNVLSGRIVNRKVRFLSAGRSAPFENYRAAVSVPGQVDSSPASVGHTFHQAQRWAFESFTGDLMALDKRADLLIKVESRLQFLLQRTLRLQWTQAGLQMSFISARGETYPLNVEASGVLHLVGLLAALYDDEVGALLIDEPEISLHPQLQAFLLQEIRQVAGDPYVNSSKKLIVLSTHAPSMLVLRRLEQISDLVFFTNRSVPPRQIAPDAEELRNRKLSALVSRLSESHRLAFFAQATLLVEGPSDEIVVNGLASKLELPLAGADAQVIPVTGKGEMPETVKLFRLMGKRTIVMADLDALADSNGLVNVFSQLEGARETANRYGYGSLSEMDRPIRDKLCAMTSEKWEDIALLAKVHAYVVRKSADTSEEAAKRRAVLATVLTQPETELAVLPTGEEWVALRRRLIVLIEALEAVGFFVLRRGTIEDYYLHSASGLRVGKPEAAAAEAAAFDQEQDSIVRQRYDDVIRAMACAAPIRRIDENGFLRGMLGGLIATAFQVMQSDMADAELNASAARGNPSALSVFRLENVSAQHKALAIRIHIASPLFLRGGFPFDIRFEENPNTVVAQRLPSN